VEKPKILIVDDSAELIRVVRDYLQRVLECDISESKDGTDAINKITSQDFDLVMLDLKMPGLNGLDVIKQARAQGKSPDILVTTGWDSSQIADEVIKAGAVDYIVKPFGLEVLKSKLKNILEKKGKYAEKV
jgi:DNA-binding response OmpR family regulator